MSRAKRKIPCMVVLSGAQTAPNLLPARYFTPRKIYIMHTNFYKSELMAQRLEMRLEELQTERILINAYEPGAIAERIKKLLSSQEKDTLVNITGGTKPMSIGALEAAKRTKNRVIYVKSQRQKTEIDFYNFKKDGLPFVEDRLTISNTITLEDYLVSYFGEDYQLTSYGKGKGAGFEKIIHKNLKPHVDQIKMGWKHKSGSVDVDAVVRCNNQVGIIEIKTGGKARKSQGIKQLAVAGGQRFFGTYTKRFLVVDQDWSELKNNRELAEAIGITVIELPGYGKTGQVSEQEKNKLVRAIHEELGTPVKKRSSREESG